VRPVASARNTAISPGRMSLKVPSSGWIRATISEVAAAGATSFHACVGCHTCKCNVLEAWRAHGIGTQLTMNQMLNLQESVKIFYCFSRCNDPLENIKAGIDKLGFRTGNLGRFRP